MDPVDADALPVGLIRVDPQGVILEANARAERWAGIGPLPGRTVDEVLVRSEDFLEVSAFGARMYESPVDDDRGAIVVRTPVPGGSLIALLEAPDRLAAGRALRDSHALADRTRTRLELVIGASIDFAAASTEARLADILAETMMRAYSAEESAVYLLDGDDPVLAAGTDPFAGMLDGASLPGAAVRLRQVLKVSSEVEGDALAPELGRAMRGAGVRSLLATPLHFDDITLGVVVCFFHHQRHFDQEATPLADALAGQAAQALARLRLRRQLEHAATHDETTGLPNRRRLELQAAAMGGEHPMAVVFIDLDGFKAVNDQLGHLEGDEVLREVSRRLQAVVRERDIVARYGGDEFVVVCEAGDPDVAPDIAERLRLAIEAPYPSLPDTISLAASIGVSTGTVVDGVLPIDRLIRAADQAMYRAKMSGGNRVADADALP